jgi:hypothetical protein
MLPKRLPLPPPPSDCRKVSPSFLLIFSILLSIPHLIPSSGSGCGGGGGGGNG